jgi:hypothetical protein
VGACGSPEESEAYGYTPAGLVADRSLRLTRNGQTISLEAGATYDQNGALLSLVYPSAVFKHQGTWRREDGPTYSYYYDQQGRGVELDGANVDWTGAYVWGWVRDVAYSAAGQLTQLSYVNQRTASEDGSTTFYDTRQQETWSYNTLGQMVTLNSLQYVYPAGTNNGRISQRIDGSSGEQVNYTYDSLNRLTSAVTTGPQWGQSFSYDGFGKLPGKR